MTRPRTTCAVVVDHRSEDDARRCLESLDVATRAPEYRVWLRVAPNSATEAPEGVTLLDVAENRGFAAAVNRAAQDAAERGVDRLLVTNADVLVHPGALAELHLALDTESEIWAAGPLLLAMEASRRVEARGMRVSERSGRLRLHGHGGVLRRGAGGDVHDGIVPFTCVLLELEAFRRLGGLPEEHFLYFEDVDFGRRLVAAGGRAVIVPRARVWHRGGRSAERLRYSARNHFRLLTNGSALRGASIAGSHLLHALRQSDVPRLEALRQAVAGLRDGGLRDGENG